MIKRARLGVNNLSERVQAQADPNSGSINLEEAKRMLTPTGVAEPKDVKRYKAAAERICQPSPGLSSRCRTRPSKSPPN